MARGLPDIDLTDHVLARVKDWSDAIEDDSVLQRVARLRATAFPKQEAYLADQHDRKSLLCPRRSGKTEAFVIEHIEDMFEQPGYQGAYITLTRTQAKRNIWRRLLKIDEEYQLGLIFHHTELTVSNDKGSVLWIGGASTPADIERWRGIFLDRATVDETGSFNADLLHDLIWEVLHYALADRMGQLIVGGTPGPVLAGEFWRATDHCGFEVTQTSEGVKRCNARPFWQRNAPEYKGVDFTWSHHRWSMKDNTAMPHIWDGVSREHKNRGDNDQDPTWQREGLGNWVADDSAFVYRYRPDVNAWRPRPTLESPHGLPEGDWRFIAGVDLGYDDDFDIEVAAWCKTSREFYHVFGFNAAGLTPSDYADEIKRTEAMFANGYDVIVGDTAGLGKAIFEELRRKHGINVVRASKTDKRDYMELLNSELMSGRARVLAGSNLETQMRALQWEDPRTKKRTHPKQDDHACDAFLYLVRYALHHFSRPLEERPEYGSDAYWRAREREEERKAEEAEGTRRSTHWMSALAETSLDGRYERVRRLGAIGRWFQ